MISHTLTNRGTAVTRLDCGQPWCRSLEYAQFHIRLPEFPAEATAQILQEFDLDAGMLDAELVEGVEAENPTFDLRIRDDRRGPRRTVEKRHFPENHSRREGREAAARTISTDKDADPTLAEEEQFIRFGTGFYDDVPGRGATHAKETFEERNLISGKSGEKLEIGDVRRLTLRVCESEPLEKTILAELEGRIVVLEGPKGLGGGGTELGAKDTPEQGNTVRMGADHGLALGDQAEGEFIK
jgi:hypothetical protein